MVLRTHTFIFADLCGYTEYTWIHGDEASAALAVGFHGLARQLAAEAGCEFVKAVGDGVMIRADDPATAVSLARRLRRRVVEMGMLPVRIGLDTGSVVARDGDWYGTAVNTAARVCEEAEFGETWLTETALNAVGAYQTMDVRDQGSHALKGLPDCQLHSIHESDKEPMLDWM